MTGGLGGQFRFNLARAIRRHWWLTPAIAIAELVLVIRAVRFVLDRVGRSEASHISRRSLSNMEKQVRSQGTSDSMWPVRSLGFRDERVPQAADEAVCPDSTPAWEVVVRGTPPVVSEPERIAAESIAAQPPDSADLEQKGQGVSAGVESKVSSEAEAVGFAPPKLPDWFWSGSSAGSSDAAQTTVRISDRLKTTEAAPEAGSRLSALRGAVSALGMKNLSRRKELAIPMRDESQRPATQAIETGTAASLRLDIPTPLVEEALVRPAEDHTVAVSAAEKPVVAELKTAAPREFIPVRKGGAADEWDTDDVRILKARRGQYE